MYGQCLIFSTEDRSVLAKPVEILGLKVFKNVSSINVSAKFLGHSYCVQEKNIATELHHLYAALEKILKINKTIKLLLKFFPSDSILFELL
jgi:hypothetical protein